MTKKDLVLAINNNSLKSITVKIECGWIDEFIFTCAIGKLILKSWKSYEQIQELLEKNNYKKSNNYFNKNIIYYNK